jgi:hypothetical protein
MNCPACRIWFMFPLRAAGYRQLLPHVNGSPVRGVLWADPTPQGPSVPLAFSVQVAYLSSLVASPFRRQAFSLGPGFPFSASSASRLAICL